MQSNEHILKTIGAIADKTQAEVYAVGGFVRDRLLGKNGKDIDFVVVGDGLAFTRDVAQQLNSRDFTVYKKFGTAMLRYGGYTLEFVGARKESYRDDSRKPEVESADLNADLARRDFTINAIAMSVNAAQFGQLVDPFKGQADLQHKIIRTPLEPEKTFHDDPLRMMRAIRFATQLDFNIEKKTKHALNQMSSRLYIISQERITDELLKILAAEKPSIGLKLMDVTSLMDIVLPEIKAMKGVEQRGEFHHKDVFDHTLKVVDNISAVSEDLRLRFVALFHDVAKPLTKTFVSGTGWTFHGHDEIGARMIKSVIKRLKLSNNYVTYAQNLIRLHLRPIQLADEEVTDSAIRRLLFQAGELVDDLITLCRADITSRNPKRVQKYLDNFDYVVKRMAEVEEKDRMRAFQSPVRGDEIMKVCGIAPGPLVGKIKKKIESAILDGEIPNEHDPAFEYLVKIKNEFLVKSND
jgi:poly(A) polymerase